MTHNNAIRANVVTERIAWIRQMIRNISHLPLQDLNTFTSDFRNVAAAESYMRRALESLLDLKRHILAKGFSIVVTEYKEIDKKLEEEGIIDSESKILFRRIAGYTDLFLKGLKLNRILDIKINYYF